MVGLQKRGIEEALRYLPVKMETAIRQTAQQKKRRLWDVAELRLRAERTSSLIFSDGESVPLTEGELTAAELGELLRIFCRGSVYACKETLSRGYLVLAGGIRVGVGGTAVYAENGTLCGVRDVSLLCMRFPHPVEGAGEMPLSLFREMGGRQGVLIWSLPGAGKTTALRDIARALSTGEHPLRVVVVDCRGELGCFLPRESTADILLGYTKATGIETAVRVLSPDVILCDEIGGEAEAQAILSVQASGVPLIASAHAASLEGLRRSPTVSMLERAGVFGAYAGLHFSGGARHWEVWRVGREARSTVAPSGNASLPAISPASVSLSPSLSRSLER